MHNDFMRDSVIKLILAKIDLQPQPALIRLDIGQLKCWSQKYPNVPPTESKLSLQLVAAAWASHDVYGDDMPQIAANLLETGLDSPSLRRLADETNVTCSADVENLVAKMFREFDLPYPMPEKQAKLIVTRQVAREVIAGERDPVRAGNYLETVIWGWSSPTKDLSALFALNDELVWDADHQRFATLITDDLIDTFGRLALLTDTEISMEAEFKDAREER